MKKSVIVLGDPLSGGGNVVDTEQKFVKANGLFIATVGDKVSCSVPFHGSAVIVEGFEKVKINKKPIAYEGCKVSCGCTLIAQHALNKVLIAIAKPEQSKTNEKEKKKAASKKAQEQVAEARKKNPFAMVDEDAESDSSASDSAGASGGSGGGGGSSGGNKNSAANEDTKKKEKKDEEYTYQLYVINPIDGKKQKTNIKLLKKENGKLIEDKKINIDGKDERRIDQEKTEYIAIIGEKKDWWYRENFYALTNLFNQTDAQVITFYFHDGRDNAIGNLEVFITQPGSEEKKYKTNRYGKIMFRFLGQSGKAEVKVKDLFGEIQKIAEVEINENTADYLFRSPKVINYFSNAKKEKK
jgi:uncharacterized Zn-binding protein involved in type VI secretion